MAGIRNLIFGAAALLLSSLPAFAQTSPGWIFGFVPTPAQWNAQWASKQDYLGASPCLVSGCTLSGELFTTASTASFSGLNVPHGVPSTSPINGDVWTTTAGMFVRINGVTIGPLSSAAASSFAATAPVTVSFGAGVTTYACPSCAVTTNPLSQFASTTSAQLSGVISDETGAGVLVFNTSPTFSGTIAGSFAFSSSLPSLVNGNAAVAASSTAGGIFTGQGSVSDLTIQNKSAQVVATVATGTQTLNVNTLTLTNALSSSYLNNATNAALGVMRGDGTTITCTIGVCTAIAAAANAIDAGGLTSVSNGKARDYLFQNGANVGHTGFPYSFIASLAGAL